MKIRKTIFKRLSEVAVLLAVELASSYLLSHLSGGYIICEIVALIIATVIFDALVERESQSKKASKRKFRSAKKKSRSSVTFSWFDQWKFRS